MPDVHAGASNDGFHLKVAIIFHQSDYSELRQIQGYNQMENSPATEADKNKAAEMCTRMGIEEVHVLSGKNNTDEVVKVFKEIETKSKFLSQYGARTFLFVYANGYGIKEQQQCFVLNCKKAYKYPIEAEVRSISNLSEDLF